MRTLFLIGGVSVVLALTGCGSDAATVATTRSASSGAVVPGGGLSVAEALSTDAEPPLAVGGWVVDSGEDARLCSGYDAGASTPCVEPSLALLSGRQGTQNTCVTSERPSP